MMIYHSQCLGYNPNVLHINRNKKTYTILSDIQWKLILRLQILKFTNKEFKAAITTMFKGIKENILLGNEKINSAEKQKLYKRYT